jgi:hypothetical protein
MSEQQFVDMFISFLASGLSPWGDVKISTEFFYQSGRTDILILTANQELIAFEAKLKDWRFAAHQAYRNTTFADRSYVLAPEKTANIANRQQHELVIRKVGLCSIIDGSIAILRPAERIDPINIYLHQKAKSSTISYCDTDYRLNRIS